MAYAAAGGRLEWGSVFAIFRLTLALIACAALTACSLDTSDDQVGPTPVSPDVATQAAETPLPQATPQPAATSAATARPRSIPTRQAEPVGTPMGSTGLLDRAPEAVRLDEDCLEQAEGRASANGPLRLPGPDPEDLELPKAYETVPFETDEALQETLQEIAGEAADDYAFVVKELATGRGAVLNADRLFNAASTFKLWVMYEVFRQESLGLLDWDDELVVTPYYDAFALSPRITTLCQVLTVAAALDAMLSVSDNAAAVLLQDLVGAPLINDAIAAFGIRHSGLFTDGLPVAAEDLALLLEAIARGQAVSREASADMLGLMSREAMDNGLAAGLPPEAVVAHKTGNWADATHDAGIVYAPFGVYVFVALTDHGYETAVIQALSAATYAHFEAATP